MLGYSYKRSTYCYPSKPRDLFSSNLKDAINKCNALDNCNCIEYDRHSNEYAIRESTEFSIDPAYDSWVSQYEKRRRNEKL